MIASIERVCEPAIADRSAIGVRGGFQRSRSEGLNALSPVQISVPRWESNPD